IDIDMTWVWLIPLCPLLGAIAAATLGPRWMPRRCGWPVIVGTAVSVALALLLLGILAAADPDPAAPNEGILYKVTGYNWLHVGTLQSYIGAYVDPLTAVMLVTVSLVSLMVVIYSAGYMAGDRGYARFFGFMGLFVFSMLMLVLADNFLMLYIFWEAVGLCSYLLIGFYYQRPAAAAAAKKAFIVNRIGDFGFAIGILLIYLNFHSVDFQMVFHRLIHDATFVEQHQNLITLIGLCLFAGACGKSAQLPLYVWLPDAMEGPSPVSALIHAATMVTAGVYMVVRCGAIFTASTTALIVVATVGCLTALFAALIALAQTDIKRILAYSTISQLGYMFLAVGVGAASAGIFHLYTHAFFKALLFLAAGAVMHAMHDHIDLKDLGGLWKDIPHAHKLFLVGALALAGCPLFAGFFSKDAILFAALNHPYLKVLGWLAVLTAALTAFYTFRCYFLAFHGPRRLPDGVEYPHEIPIMTYAMIPLAAGAFLAGYVNIGWFGHGFDSFLGHSPSVMRFDELAGGGHGISHLLVGGLSLLLFAAGLIAAAILYLPNQLRAVKLGGTFEATRRLLANKFYVDEIYDAVFVVPLRRAGRFCFGSDNWIIDSILWIITFIPRLAGALLQLTQRGRMQTYALWMLTGLAIIFLLVLRAL
ncbi:MAG: NADH-quinone oxidoreductase subunit L, partial [Sedimentisphaerales bacterium]|nr:NADH-quinone oxidoreductase subunit L [Sedimentisphaerales bacterium]